MRFIVSLINLCIFNLANYNQTHVKNLPR